MSVSSLQRVIAHSPSGLRQPGLDLQLIKTLVVELQAAVYHEREVYRSYLTLHSLRLGSEYDSFL